MSSTRVIYFMYHHLQHCSNGTAPSMPPKSPESFTVFPLLPPELRLRIWETITLEPHTVELSCTPTAAHMPNGKWFSHFKPSMLFSICSESRDVALAHYSILRFSPEQIGIPWPRLYINFSTDTLWLCADLHVLWAKNLLEKNEQLKESLRSLVVNEMVWKALNPVFFTPGFAMVGAGVGYVEVCPKGVPAGLRALEDVRFHN